MYTSMGVIDIKRSTDVDHVCQTTCDSSLISKLFSVISDCLAGIVIPEMKLEKIKHGNVCDLVQKIARAY